MHMHAHLGAPTVVKAVLAGEDGELLDRSSKIVTMLRLGVLLVGFAVLGHCHDEILQQCAVDPRTRVECGLFKLNQILCHLRGCCYREITPDVHKCYKAEVPPICEVPAHERTTCGYPFISVDACNQEGCCFDARLWPSEWCFRPSSSSR